MKPKLFVGSSVEGLSVAYAVHQNLQYQSEVTVWDQGVFHLSKSALDSLIQVLDRSDFGVFIFSPDDIVNIRGEENRVVRDNVLFELGLFVGRLGKDRSFILMPDLMHNEQSELHLPTDLIGMTPGKYETDRADGSFQAATGPVCHQIGQVIADLGSVSQSSNTDQAPQSRDQGTKAQTTEAEQAKAEEVEADQPAIKDEPHWISIFYAGHYDEVVPLLEQKIKASNNEKEKLGYETWIGRAKAKKDLKAGIAYLTKLSEDSPQSDDPYLALASVYKDLGFIDQALGALDTGLSRAVDKQWLRYLKASYLYSEGAVDEAHTLLNELMADSPDFAYSYEWAAKLLVDEGKKSEAIRAYEKGLTALPNNESLLYEYGKLLLDVRHSEGAVIVFRKLNNLFSENSAYLAYLGNAYLNLDLNGLSLEAYQKASELSNQKESWIIANIGNIFNNQGFYPQAREYLKKAIDLDVDSAYAHERLATAIKNEEEERKKADEIVRKFRQSTKQMEGSKENPAEA